MTTDRHARVERECEYCGSKFMARVERVNAGQGRFCSLKHANLFAGEHPTQLRGYENGRKYWNGEYWIIRWYDEKGGQHTTSYPKWWWTMHRGEVPDGYVVTFKDGNAENLSPKNFVLMENRELHKIIGERHKGFKFTKKSKLKMSLARTGKPLSEEHKANIGKSVKMRWERGDFDNIVFTDISGDKNPGWRGGVGHEYPEEFSRSLKKFVWERDKSICQICGTYVSRKGVVGHIHHIDGDKTNSDYDNLILLCIYCHGKIHKSKDVSSPVIMAFRDKLIWNQ